MNKTIFDIVFIILAAGFLILWVEFGEAETYLVFSFIPLLVAYQLGKYSEKRSKNRPS
jgi:hypothetical protein